MQKCLRGSAMGNHKPLSFFYGIDKQVHTLSGNLVHAEDRCRGAIEFKPRGPAYISL